MEGPAMKTTTQSSTTLLQHTRTSGWSAPFPKVDGPQTLVLVFASRESANTPEPFRELRAAFPTSQILGCSTSGEIMGPDLCDGTMSVAILPFRHTTLTSAFAPVRNNQDSFNAGVVLAHQLNRPGLRGILVLSDGLRVNGTELVRGLTSILSSDVVITGGLAGDAALFKETWVLHNATPESGMVSAIGLYGDRVHIGHGSRGGWTPFGPERRITKSHDNVLLELDGNPALELYKKYLGERAKDLPSSGLLFPLAIRPNPGELPVLVRTILQVSDADNSMTFAGDIPQGWSAQLMRANFDWLVEASAESARDSCQGAYENPQTSLTIAISCVGRRLILGDRAEEELHAAYSSLPQGTNMIGFYSFGELSPHAKGEHCELHNQSMTTTTISEK